MKHDLTGGCLCGNIRYSVPVAAIRFGFASCHCSLCRRAHGAPVVMWSGVGSDAVAQFRVENAAEGTLSSYRSTPSCTRFFCARCGTHTHLAYDSDAGQWANETHIATATIDDECLPALETHIATAGKPRALHVYYSDRAQCVGDFAAWVEAPKYGGPSGTEPIGD